MNFLKHASNPGNERSRWQREKIKKHQKSPHLYSFFLYSQALALRD